MTNKAAYPIAVLLVTVSLIVGCQGTGSSPGGGTHRSFATPEEAVEALVSALERGNQTETSALFGPGTDELVGSGDPVQDTNDRKSFVEKYRTKHSLVEDGADKRTLVVGEDDWPLPVPIVLRDGRWYFNGAEGAEELVYRRIGRNELGAIAACRGFVEAQHEYAATGHDGDPPGIYALKLLSDEGRQNGLYWKTGEDEPPSPVGEFVANAAAEGYRRGGGSTYHGYEYRMLYRQGPHAKGGARDYFQNGLLTRGFALVAWPAEMGMSGIMTFIINQDGVVYQKDLGDDTEEKIAAMTAFDPDASWKVVPE